MKKAYSRPEIVFESFSLSVSIAACQNEAVHDASLGKWGCKGYKLRTGEVIFIDALLGCTTPDADGDYNGFCYDIPSQSLNLFGS